MYSRRVFKHAIIRRCLGVLSTFTMLEMPYSRAFSDFLTVAIVDGVHTYVYAGIFPIAQSGNTTRGWINEILCCYIKILLNY